MKRVLVLKGEGLNCERETAAAFQRFGAHVDILNVRELLSRPARLLESDILALPGGFSYGDEIQSGHILGMALKDALKDVWPMFLRRKGLAIGICNGFQTLMKMGVFESERTIALVHNSPAGFQDRWVTMNVQNSKCVWTRGMEGKKMQLPMRHGEGRIWSESTTPEMLKDQGQVVFTYSENVNGSMGQIAGITDASGQVLGLMPHPEAALETWLMPDVSMNESIQFNAQLFQNALQYSGEVTHA